MSEDADTESPIVLGGRRLTSAESGELWEGMQTAFNSIVPDAARIDDPLQPWLAPNAAALDRRSLASWIQSLQTTPICRQALDAMMTADNGVQTAWQSYLGDLAAIKGHGLGMLDRDRSVPLRRRNQQLATRLADGIGLDRIGCARRRPPSGTTTAWRA
jgi:hypothetical protein